MKKSKKRSFFYWAIFVINFFVAFALLASYASPWISPSLFWPIAFIGLAYPFIFLLNIIFAIYWVLRLRWVAIVSFSMIALGYQVHPKVFAFQMPSPVETNPDSTLRIMSYNAHSFRPINTNKYDKKSKHSMLELLLSEKADIICFQEFYTRKRGEYAIKDSLQKFSELKYYRYQTIDSIENEIMSQAIFSKYPIINYHKIPFYEGRHPNMCSYADVVIQSDTIRIINVHLQSISFKPKDYNYFHKVTTEAETNLQSSRRIGSRLKNAFIRRATQAELVRELIDESEYKVIVCGDFNDTPNSYAFNVIGNGLKSAFQEKGSGLGTTYGGAFPNFQIDYILCDPAMDVLNYKIIKKKYSDHYPVIADIQYNK